MIAWSFEALAASAALMLVVLAIRMPVARYFGPHIAYGLWALPALRLILPPLPEEVAPAPLATLPSTIEFEWLLAAPARADAAASGVDWALLLATLWIVGAAVFLAWHLLSYRHFVGKALADATQLPRFDRDGIEVCASPAAQGPFAAGIFLKKIVLPEDYRSRYEADELRLALEHEVQHHRRCDISANLIALVVLAFHWWNPIAYFAHRAFRVEQELACDAAVLAQATAAERHAYGAALLKSACDRLPVAACALGAGDDLKRRLRMMKTYRFSPSRARMGGLLAAGLVGGGLMLTASNGIAAETSARVEREVRTALAPVVPVLAPTVPVPPVPAVPPRGAKASRARVGLVPPSPEPAAAPPPPPPPALVAPTPPVPPAPPPPPGQVASAYADVAVDGDAIRRQVQEELGRELPRIRGEIARARAQAHGCGRASASSGDGDARAVLHCHGWSERDQRELRRTVIASLERAREGVRRIDRMHMPPEARRQALEAIDRQLDQLRK